MFELFGMFNPYDDDTREHADFEEAKSAYFDLETAKKDPKAKKEGITDMLEDKISNILVKLDGDKRDKSTKIR